jgi:hypothetical protein
MSTQEYCKRWFMAKQRPIDVMTAEDALKLHQSDEAYTVVIKDLEGSPRNLVDIANDTYLISFLDDLKRIYLSYQFNVVEGKLFLAFATHHEYDVETGKEVEKSVYAFKPDGSLYIEKRDYITSEFATANNSIDVSGNWESLPKFGCYESITKESR